MSTNLKGLKQNEQEAALDKVVGHRSITIREHNGHFVYRVTAKLKDGYAIKNQQSGKSFKLTPKHYGDFEVLD